MRIRGLNRLMALGAGLAMLAGTGRADTQVINQDVYADTTWYGTNTYILQTVVFVTNGATLTIEPGTIIRAERDTLFGTNNAPGTLVISRGSKIRAMGTAEAPIVMTTTNDDHFVGLSPTNGTAPWNQQNNQIGRQWGGLILLGNTYVARTTNSPSAGITVQIEGLQPFGTKSEYGGGNDDDDSGELHYVSVRYGGFVLGAANEINGVSLGAVGRNTEIDHIEVFQNKDDGYEFFGGTVNTKYLVSWNNADDSFDWDEGFRGKGQFWLAVQGPLTQAGTPDFSDKGAEMDGATVADVGQPSSCPTIYNATFVGDGKGTKTDNEPMHFRDGGGGRFYNSLFLDFGGACGVVEGSVGGSYDSADLTASNYPNNAFYTHGAGGKMLEVKNSLFWNMGSNDWFSCAANGTLIATPWIGSDTGTDGNKAHYKLPVFTDTTLSNFYLPEDSGYPVVDATNLPIIQLVRSAHGVYGSGIAYTDTVLHVYYPVEGINPTLTNTSPLLAAGLTPPTDGFFTPISMVGAFGTRNWAGWTLASKQGTLYSDYVNGDYSAFDENPSITNNFLSFTVQFPTAAAQNYDVQWAPAVSGPWETLSSVVGTGGTITYTDARPNIAQRYYRLLSAITP